MLPILSLCEEADKEQILGIINDAIINTTALYDYKPRDIEGSGHDTSGRFQIRQVA